MEMTWRTSPTCYATRKANYRHLGVEAHERRTAIVKFVCARRPSYTTSKPDRVSASFAPSPLLDAEIAAAAAADVHHNMILSQLPHPLTAAYTAWCVINAEPVR